MIESDNGSMITYAIGKVDADLFQIENGERTEKEAKNPMTYLHITGRCRTGT